MHRDDLPNVRQELSKTTARAELWACVCVCVCVCMRERERERQRQRARQREAAQSLTAFQQPSKALTSLPSVCSGRGSLLKKHTQTHTAVSCVFPHTLHVCDEHPNSREMRREECNHKNKIGITIYICLKKKHSEQYERQKRALISRSVKARKHLGSICSGLTPHLFLCNPADKPTNQQTSRHR